MTEGLITEQSPSMTVDDVEAADNFCFNKHWDIKRETVFEFERKMIREHGWIQNAMKLKTPKNYHYPALRVDHDSILYTLSIDYHAFRQIPYTEVNYIGPIESHFTMLEGLRERKVLTDQQYNKAKKFLFEKKRLTEHRTAVTHSAGGRHAEKEEKG